MKLRLVIDADLPKVLPILLPYMEQYYADDHLRYEAAKAESTIREFVADPRLGRLWLLMEEASSRVVGYLVFTFGFSFECGGREAFVDELFVLPSHRGKGVGSEALRLAVAEAKREGIHAIRLEITRANDRAKRLYQRLGFTDLGRSLMVYWVSEGSSSELRRP